MNILTIGIRDNTSQILNQLLDNSSLHEINHLLDKDDAIEIIKDPKKKWDWIIIQGDDDPNHWKSLLCAVNANAENTPITVLSSHLDGTRLNTPVCSMHNSDHGMSVSRCAMQSMLQEEKSTINLETVDVEEASPTPIIFEYHAPCS